MREPQHVEIGLVDRVHPLLDPARHHVAQLWQVPCQRDAERREQIGERNCQRDARGQNAGHSPRSAQRAPRAEHEQQLPGERIERPITVRIRRKIPVVTPGQRIKCDRDAQRCIGPPLHQPQDHRQEKHQHDVKRQHVHVDGTKSQQQRLDDGDVRLLEKIHDPHFFGVQRVFETGGDIGDFRKEDREQEHVRDVNLPDPTQDARARHDKAGLQHRAAVDESRGIAGDENEYFGGVAESVIADGEPGQQVRRQMIDEDQPQRQPAEKIEPQFALAGHRQCNRGQRLGRRLGRCRLVAHSRVRPARERSSGNSIGNGSHLAPVLKSVDDGLLGSSAFTRFQPRKDSIGTPVAGKSPPRGGDWFRPGFWI